MFLLGHFKGCCCISYLHAFSYHCIRVDAAAEGAIYAVVAEPQEPQGSAPQEEVRGESAQGPLTPVLSSRRKASPGAHPSILNYDAYVYVLLLVH